MSITNLPYNGEMNFRAKEHYTDQGEAYDKERDTIIEKYGVVILRFSNLEIDRCFDSVCERIHDTIHKRVVELERNA